MNSDQKRQITAYYLSFFSFGLIIAIMGPALPFLAEHTGVSLNKAALLFTMSSIGFFTGSLVSGNLYDHLPGNRILAGAWLISVVTAFIIPVLSSFSVLSIVIMFFGFANGTIVVGCNSLITRVDRQRTGTLINGMHIVNGMGAFLTPLLFAWSISSSGDIILAYRGYALFFVFVLVILAGTPTPSDSRAVPAGEDADAGKDANAGAAAKAAAERQPKPGLFTPVNLFVLLLALNTMIYVGSEISFTGWIFTYIRTLFPGADRQAGYINSAFWLFITAGRIISVITIRLMPARKLLVFYFSGAAAGLTIIIAGSAHMSAIWAGTVLAGLSMGAIFPMLMTFGETSVGLTGKVSGVIFAGTSIGGMVFPFLTGQIFTFFSPQAIMVSILITILTALTIFLALRARAAKLPPRNISG